MVGTIAIVEAKAQPFEIQPSKSPDFKWTDFRSPVYSYFNTRLKEMASYAYLSLLFNWLSVERQLKVYAELMFKIILQL